MQSNKKNNNKQITPKHKQCQVKIELDNSKDTAGPKIIKLFSCSTQLSMKFILLINLKLLTTANSFLLNIAEHENFSANNYENTELSMKKGFITSGP